jgi:hypothetical protein
MTHYYCYECKNGHGESNGPCEYIDPIGELHNADHIKCSIGDAKWVRKSVNVVGRNVDANLR